MSHPTARPLRSYDAVAGSYELMSRLYSAGRIAASKRAQLPFIASGDRVLYLGVGSGEDALLAARKGAVVTCLDLSPAMLDRLRRRLRRDGLDAELVCGDAFEFDRAGRYDAVAANYFLNCFREEGMRRMLRHAAGLVRPGGRLMVADVAPPQGNPLARGFAWAYLRSAMALFWAMRLVPWHRNYDYAAEMRDAGLTVTEVTRFRFLGFGPVVFQNQVAERR